MEAIEPDRTFYQGILQLAVGLYHLSNYNWRGAVILLGEGIGRLQSYRPDYGTVDLDQLIDQSQTLLKALQTSGDEAMAEGRSKTLEPYVQLLRETTQEVPEAVSRELSVPKIKRQPSKCQARM
jgi:predicted metal-dependent hydrolase